MGPLLYRSRSGGVSTVVLQRLTASLVAGCGQHLMAGGCDDEKGTGSL